MGARERFGKGERERGREEGSHPFPLSLFPPFLLSAFLLLLLALLAGCDAAEPGPDRLVLEAFVETGRPLPALTVRRTAGLGSAESAPPVADAEVVLTLGETPVSYRPDPARPGRYVPQRPLVPAAGEALGLEVTWQGQRATAASALPEAIVLDSVRLSPAASPVEAVFADSLGLDLREGWLYPVTVTLHWAAPAEADSARWVRARLRPPGDFPSAVVDFLLRTDQTIQEDDLETQPGGAKRWTGLYAVPVEGPESPLPAHAVKVYLLRSGPDYARYALTRADPDRREPIGNVEGGLGIVAGISFDTLTVRLGD